MKSKKYILVFLFLALLPIHAFGSSMQGEWLYKSQFAMGTARVEELERGLFLEIYEFYTSAESARYRAWLMPWEGFRELRSVDPFGISDFMPLAKRMLFYDGPVELTHCDLRSGDCYTYESNCEAAILIVSQDTIYVNWNIFSEQFLWVLSEMWIRNK